MDERHSDTEGGRKGAGWTLRILPPLIGLGLGLSAYYLHSFLLLLLFTAGAILGGVWRWKEYGSLKPWSLVVMTVSGVIAVWLIWWLAPKP